MEEEIWKDIPECTDYQASNLGRIKSLKWGKQRILKTIIKADYENVFICGKCYKVHRLVAQTFIPNDYNKPIVNHIDENKTNNKAENLEWVTNKENVRHSIKTGTADFRKPIVQLTMDYKLVAEWTSAKDAAIGLGFSSAGNISAACCNIVDTAFGYRWMHKHKFDPTTSYTNQLTLF